MSPHIYLAFYLKMLEFLIYYFGLDISFQGDNMGIDDQRPVPPKPTPPKGMLITEGHKPPPTPPQPQRQQVTAKELLKELDNRGVDLGDLLLQKLIQRDGHNGSYGVGITRGWLIAIAVIVSVFTLVILIGSMWVTSTINRMNESYTAQTEQIIFTKSEIEQANSWERLPPLQKKEKLREQYYAIVRYYTNEATPAEKMDDAQILQSFNALWLATERLTSVNFFFPVAFMRATTNFNPYFDKDSRIGMGYFYLNGAEAVSNLNLVRSDPVFMLEYKGTGSLNDPIDTIKLLVARIDDLSKIFHGREDWIFLALLTNEYDVISRYWRDGTGTIPDDMYLRGPLAECLKYYHSFKNWDIPKK